MDGKNWTAAQTQGGGQGAAGAAAGVAAGAMDSGDWRTQLPPDSRQRIISKIMGTFTKHIPVHRQAEVQELREVAVRFEEKMYNAATSRHDYVRKISIQMVKLETKYENPMTNSILPNTASSGENAHGPEVTMEATSYETTSGPEDNDEEAEEEDVSKEDVVEEVVVTKEQNYVVGLKENVRVGENEIACELSSGAKLDERLAQAEERLEKMKAHSEKVETLLVDINEKLNYLVKMQDAKVSRDIRRPTKYMSSSWTGNGRSMRKHRVAEMIRQSCKCRRLGEAQ